MLVEESPLARQLAERIIANGPISIADFFATANMHYYGTRDPLGKEGDFITAPEISQMFGELIGLWFADIWLRMNKPRVHFIELGPGRGTLARDALRAMAMVGLQPDLHLVETSLTLRLRQAENLTGPTWHEDVSSLPDDAPLFIMANEFFDALPIQQIVKDGPIWRKRMVDFADGRFVPELGREIPLEIVPEKLRFATNGSIIETSPASVRVMGDIAQRIRAQGGVGLIVDYGYEGVALGETLQAVKAHQYASPFEEPGERDLTAHVDFETLGAMAELQGVKLCGPIGQGQWLARLGLVERAAALGDVHPDRAQQFADERDRLVGEDAMGRLFKAFAFYNPDWPEPDGF